MRVVIEVTIRDDQVGFTIKVCVHELSSPALIRKSRIMQLGLVDSIIKEQASLLNIIIVGFALKICHKQVEEFVLIGVSCRNTHVRSRHPGNTVGQATRRSSLDKS